jgi:hypothetical protein
MIRARSGGDGAALMATTPLPERSRREPNKKCELSRGFDEKEFERMRASFAPAGHCPSRLAA